MADSTSRSAGSHSTFLPLETESGVAEDDDEDQVNEYAPRIENEEYLRSLFDKEIDRNRILPHVDDWIKIARSEAIQWIINMRVFLQLQFHTAYLSVTYIDRFLSNVRVTMNKPWVIRLLAVACLSLAAKMKEIKVWALSEFRTEGYDYESNLVHRMELLVLTKLDWRMRSITPFHFIDFFISSFNEESPNPSPITQIIFATIKDVDIMGYRSSTIAMAATLMVMDQNLTKESLEMKVKSTRVNQHFSHEDVYTCYSRMLELEAAKANIYKDDITHNVVNPSVGTKRKRLTFSEDDEKKPNQ